MAERCRVWGMGSAQRGKQTTNQDETIDLCIDTCTNLIRDIKPRNKLRKSKMHVDISGKTVLRSLEGISEKLRWVGNLA